MSIQLKNVIQSRTQKTRARGVQEVRNNVQVQRANQQKHLGIILDEKLNFKSHIDKVLTKASKGIAVIKRLRNFLPRKSLITIYKAIIRPHLDYGDILYDQPNYATFCQKIESVQ